MAAWASNNSYIVSIENITEFEDVTQRAQVTHGDRVYDISWDSANDRVVAYYVEQDELQWFEIRCDGTFPYHIALVDVLTAFGCISEDTMPVLNFPLDQGYAVENYLVTAISADFLCQLSVLPVLNQPLADQETPIEDDDTLPSAGLGISVGDDEDPTPTSSDNESIEEDSDDPCYQQV